MSKESQECSVSVIDSVHSVQVLSVSVLVLLLAVTASAYTIVMVSERSALVTRFNELGAARAGLNARWRELEEEARRAGAPPGRLRP